MPDATIALHVSVTDAPEDGATTVRLDDQYLNYALSDDLKRGIKELCRKRLARGVRRFIVDLAPVAVMDSCGLSILISVKKAIEGDGGRLALASLSPTIARLFEVTKLDRSFEIHATPRAALAAMQQAC